MHFVDPLKQPQRFIQQADALVRQSFAHPDGTDPFQVIDAHLEASFEAVLARESGADRPAVGEASHVRAGGPVSDPTLSTMPTNLPWVSGGANAWPVGTSPVGGPSAMGWAGAGQARAPMGPELERLIAGASAKHQVPDWLVRNVIRAESGGNPQATSPVGAMGLMQLMPGTAATLGVSDAYDAEQNVDGGTRYLRQLLDRFGGDYSKAVAAYNAGPGAVERYDGVPPFAETQAYVKRVLE
jgi:hypothetical protein